MTVADEQAVQAREAFFEFSGDARLMAAEIVKHRAEIDALKAAWLRVIQAENSCRATGLPCDAKRCWCEMERQELARVEDAIRE